MDGIIASFACRRINTAHPMILVTGGAGFIGANFVLDWIANGDEPVVNLDKLTYAGNLHNLDSVQGNPRHIFVQGDIGDTALLERLLAEHQPRAIVNFAAESHVDRSIHGPEDFIQTNVVGTFRLLEAARQYWQALPAIKKEAFRFLHVSTDEVYGTLSATDPAFTEDNRYEPNSPYSASKAASDHLVRAWHHTYGLPVLTTNCSNNYGPLHFPEKLIPLMIVNALAGKNLPVYGDGMQVRDWLYVRDHCSAIRRVLEAGRLALESRLQQDLDLRIEAAEVELVRDLERRNARDQRVLWLGVLHPVGCDGGVGEELRAQHLGEERVAGWALHHPLLVEVEDRVGAVER